jgi:TolB-like protein
MIKKYIVFPLGFISVVLFSFYYCEAALTHQTVSLAGQAIVLDSSLFPAPQPSAARGEGIYGCEVATPAGSLKAFDETGFQEIAGTEQRGKEKYRYALAVKGIVPSLLHWEPGHEGVRYLSAKADSFKNEKSKIKIGIIEFQSLNEEAKKDILGKVFSEVLTTSFVNSNAFKIIEREQLEKVLKELQLTQTGIIDTAYAKQIGKMLGADAILTGTVIKFGNDLRVDARIIDVESGLILTAEKGMGKADLKSISTMADSIVQNLVNKFYRGKR